MQLARARAIVDYVVANAGGPVSVFVADSHGELVAAVTMDDAAPDTRLNAQRKAYTAARSHAAFVVPMKAVLTQDRPAGPEWVFERKLDGIRCLAVKDDGRTRLYSRNELSLNHRYAPLAAALDADPADQFVIDGEAVGFLRRRDRFCARG